MLFVSNLAEFIRLIFLEGKGGLYYPQNKELVNTIEMGKLINKYNNMKMKESKFLGTMIKSMSTVLEISIFNKAFGNLYYDMGMSGHFDWRYCLYDFAESIELTELYWEKINEFYKHNR